MCTIISHFEKNLYILNLFTWIAQVQDLSQLAYFNIYFILGLNNLTMGQEPAKF
jgi:hypothetical protein